MFNLAAIGGWKIVGWIVGLFRRKPAAQLVAVESAPASGKTNVVSVLFVVVALAFGVGSLYSMWQKKSYKVVLAEKDRQIAEQGQRLTEQEAKLKSYEEQEADLAEAMRKQAADLKAARESSATAMADLKRQQSEAAKGVASWAKVYKERPELCKAALETLDASCPSLRNY